MTRARILTFNMRRSTALEIYPSRRWSNRKRHALDLISRAAPSVVIAQECTLRQATDITNGLGPNWTFWGEPSNRQVLWDGAKWDAVDTHSLPINSGGRVQVATFVRLRSRKTKDLIWFVSVHLTQGSSNAIYRHQEMLKILAYLQTLPGYQVSVIAGDLNSDGETDGVRKLAAQAGWKSLRARTSDDQLSREHYSTWNGWRRTRSVDLEEAHYARWIDDILTPFAVKPYSGSVELACLRVYQHCASDHNAVRASIEF